MRIADTPNPALTESLRYGKMSVCTEQTFALESRQTWPRDAARLQARGHLLYEQLTDYGHKLIAGEAMLPDEKLTTQLHIRISPQLKDELDKAAGKQQTTVPVYCARRLDLSLLANLTPG